MGASPCSTGGGGDGVYKFLSSVLCLLLYIGRALMGWWWGSGDWTGSLVALGSANRVEHEGRGYRKKTRSQAEEGAVTLSTATARPCTIFRDAM